MTKKYSLIAMLLTATMIFTACSKDNPRIPNEEELITTLNYILTPAGGGTAVIFSFQDLDGDGDDPPIISNGILASNQTYTGELELLNEAETIPENITEEIAEEDEDHQFFFQYDVPNLSIAYNDQDADGNPIGLSSTLTTGDAASGSLTIILKHEPNKFEAGVAEGDISNAGGETDIQVTFEIDVQ